MSTARPASGSPLWRNHDYRLLWTGETVSALGSSMSFLVLPLIGLALTGSPVQAALTGTAFAAASTVCRLPAGVLVDRWDRKKVMVASNALGACCYAGLGLGLVLHRLALWHLVAVAVLTGITTAFFSPAENAALRRVVPAEQLPTAFSQNQARQHAASLVGPPLGGVLYGAVRWAPFVVDAVTYAVSALALTRLEGSLTPPSDTPTSLASLRADTASGVRFLLSRGFFRAFLAFAAAANFSVQALFTILVLKLATAGVPAAQIGLVETCAAGAGLAGAVLAPMLIERTATGALSITGGLVIAAVVLPMAFTDSPWLIGALFAAGMLLNPAGNAAISSYVTTITPDDLQGRVSSALVFCATVVQPLGPLTGGLLLHLLGPRTGMVAAAALTALSVLPLVGSREVRALPRPARWGVEQSAAA